VARNTAGGSKHGKEARAVTPIERKIEHVLTDSRVVLPRVLAIEADEGPRHGTDRHAA